jgi:predicted metal-dependent HD superfamily phosphohydrolase
MNEEILLQDAKSFVSHLFDANPDSRFLFHNISHTQSVVKATDKIAQHYQLDSEDKLALTLAAWFHDTGFSKGSAENHETESQRIVTAFLTERNIEKNIIDKVTRCIQATQFPTSPDTIIEKILCDADLYHLGTADFEKETKLLRQELNNTSAKPISKSEWRKINISFLRNNNYFTDYCKTKLEPVKQRHLKELLFKEFVKNELNSSTAATNTITSSSDGELVTAARTPVDEKKAIANEKATREKDNRAERGIATMFRIMSDNHVSLSQMADSKANIMISVNTIVLSILVSVLLGKLQYYPQFIFPTILLAMICLSAIVFAILATRPNITRGTFTKEDILNKKTNLLFFGNFHKMELPDYDWAMKEMMNDREYLYGSMTKDIYFLGKVLAKKYNYLRTSYTIFMIGLVASVIAFGIAAIIGAGN